MVEQTRTDISARTQVSSSLVLYMGWIELTDYPKMAHNKKNILVNYKIFNASTHITNFNPIFF
jgi:hypothetical protein